MSNGSASFLTDIPRNFELCGLQARNITPNCEGLAPYNIPHFKVHLDNRKGWQKKAGYDGPLESE